MSDMKIVTLRSPRAVMARLDHIERKEIPFAMAKSLTNTAQAFQGVMQKRADKIFTVRTGWNKKSNKYGFRVRPATKSHWEAAVYNRAPFLVEHEGAQTRTPKGKHFAIPTEETGITRRGLIPKGQKPKNNPRLFKLGKKGKALYQRKQGKLVRIYNLGKKAKLPKDLGFYVGARKYIPRKFKTIFRENLRIALATRRR